MQSMPEIQSGLKKLMIISGRKFNEQQLDHAYKLISGARQETIYKVTIAWAEQILNKYVVTGKILYQTSDDIQKVKQAIFFDLLKQQYHLKEYTKMIIREQRKMAKIPRTICEGQSWGKVQTCISLQCLVIQRKVNLPADYSYSPIVFPGFTVQNFSILNQHGCITWNQPLDIEGVDFSSGIKILEGSVEISNPRLSGNLFVEFYRLPKCVQEEFQNKRQNEFNILQRLKEYIYPSRLISFCGTSNHWFAHIEV